MRISVAGLLDPTAPVKAGRRPLVDVRQLLEARPAAPRAAISSSARYSRAVSMADAAMIIGLGDSPSMVRSCATTVTRALDAVDEAGLDAVTRVDAANIILARCGQCGRCNGRI